MKEKKYYYEVMEKLNFGMALLEEKYESIAAAHNITYNRLMIIYILMEDEQVTQMDICQAMHLPKSTVHSIVVSMQKDGLIVLQEGSNGKEKYVVTTERGREQFQTIYDDVRGMEIELLDSIPEADLQHLLRIIDKIAALESKQ